MSNYLYDKVDRVFDASYGQNSKVIEQEKKVKNAFGELPKKNNPFLDQSGSLFNKYIDYQKVLENPNVTQKAKKFISQATGFAIPDLQSAKNEKSVSPEPFEQSKTLTEKVGSISAKYEAGGANGGTVSSGKGRT